jgi:hypothetical protein
LCCRPLFGFPFGLGPTLQSKCQLSSKIYLSTIVGFGAVTPLESTIARFESIYGGGTDTILARCNFALLPGNAPLGAQPYCEDFDEQICCGQPSNVNACANNASPIPGATGSTICGNGIVEVCEDCDPGTGSSCAPTCRF